MNEYSLAKVQFSEITKLDRRKVVEVNVFFKNRFPQ